MEAVIARASFFYYFLPSLFLVFGVAALALAAIGLYAVMTFAVRVRRVEMGVRRALGATRLGVVTLVYRALSSGSLDVVVDDFPIGAWFSRQSGGLHVSPLDGTDARYATVMRHDDSALKTALDGAILATLADGTYASAYVRWLEPVVGDACDVTAGTRRRRW